MATCYICLGNVTKLRNVNNNSVNYFFIKGDRNLEIAWHIPCIKKLILDTYLTENNIKIDETARKHIRELMDKLASDTTVTFSGENAELSV